MDVSIGIAGTLRAESHGNNPVVAVYGLSSKASNAWQSSNPHSGCYEAETTRTLDTRGGDPTCNQGGTLIIQPRVYENHGQDNRYRDLGDTCETVTAKYGTGGNNQPIVLQPQPYSIGNGQTHSLYLDEKARTLDAMHDAQAIITPAYGIDRAAFNQGKNAQYGFSITEEIEPCLVAKGPNAVAQPTPNEPYPYIARRLTPLECSRLQGYPDYWRQDLETENPAEEEIDFWAAVFETHRQATAPKKKPKSRKQIAKWLKDPQSDSAEYKMWGNSLAIPNAYQVLAGIAEAINETTESTKEGEAMKHVARNPPAWMRETTATMRNRKEAKNQAPPGQMTIWDFYQESAP